MKRASWAGTHPLRERGAAAVEFALVMPILLMLVFAILQYGLYFWAAQGGSDIARDAARRAAVGQPLECSTASGEGFADIIEDQVAAIAGTSDVEVTRTYTPAPTSNTTDGLVEINDTVNVTVSFKSIDLRIPLVPRVRDGLVTARAEGRVEYVPEQPEPCP
ncbi:MAG TPA: TadE family protein [Nocardioides sp.]|uniref:TadE family protein n=1 Tax=Nocardioides sp. TaxID=35761 RepID=UPI002EDAF160